MTELRSDTKAVVETQLVHDVHRAATSMLVDVMDTDDVEARRRLVDFVVSVLRHHHQSEDDVLWPTVRAAAPELTESLAELTREHHVLDASLDALARSASEGGDQGLLTNAVLVRDMVHEHLAREEPILFPALHTRVSPEAWDAFSRHAVATSPPEAGPLLMAFFARVGPPEAVEVVLAGLPVEMRAGVPTLLADGESTLARLLTGRPR